MFNIVFKKYIDLILKWLVLGIVFSLPIVFDFGYNISSAFVLSKILLFRILLYILLIFCALWIILFKKIKIHKDNVLYWSLIIWVLFLILNTILSLYPGNSFWGSYTRQQGFLLSFECLIFFLLLLSILKKYIKLKTIILTIVFSAVLPCLYGVLQYLNLDFIIWTTSNDLRITSTFGQPNFFGYYLLLVIPLTIFAYWFYVRKFYFRVLMLILLILEFVSLYFTLSRSSWIGLIFGVFIFVWLLAWHKKRKKICLGLLISCLFIVVLIAVFALNNSVRDDSNRMISSLNLESGSVAVRLQIWQSGLYEFSNGSIWRMLFGYGQESQSFLYINAYDSYYAVDERIDVYPDRSHNFILDILLQYGFFGLILLLFISIYILHKAIIYLKHSNNNPIDEYLVITIIASLLSLAVANLFNFLNIVNQIFYLTELAILYVIISPNNFKIYNLDKTSLFSRVILWISFVIFLVWSCYYSIISYYLSDKNFSKAYEWLKLDNCHLAVKHARKATEYYSLNNVYKKGFLYIGRGCLNKMDNKDVATNLVVDMFKQMNTAHRPDLDVIYFREEIKAYVAMGEYIDPAYFQDAIDGYEKLLKINPYFSYIYEEYGDLLVKINEPESAIMLYKQGLDVLPDLSWFVYDNEWKRMTIDKMINFNQLIGDIYYNESDYDKALNYYNYIFDLDPSYLGVYKRIANVFYQKKDLDNAISYQLRGYNLDSDNYQRNYDLALLYNEKGNILEAKKYAEQALSLDKNNKQIIEFIKKLQ